MASLLRRALTSQIEHVVDEVIQCVLESAREQWPLRVDGKETRAGVDGCVAGHALPPGRMLQSAVRGLMGTRILDRLGFLYNFVSHLCACSH